MDEKWLSVYSNPPENWREVWRNRISLSRFDSEKMAQKFIDSNQKEYEQELKIDLHPKDGYVVYYSR